MSIARQYGVMLPPDFIGLRPVEMQESAVDDVLVRKDNEISRLKAEVQVLKGMLADANKMLIGNAVTRSVTPGNAAIMDPVTLTAISVTQDDIIERRKAQTAERVRKYREKRREKP